MTGRSIALAGLAAASLAFGAATWFRNAVWRTEGSLWRDAIEKAPEKPRAYTMLGLDYDAHEAHSDAEILHRESVRVSPDYASGWLNLSFCLHRQGRDAEALDPARRAVQLAPRSVRAQCNLGFLVENLPGGDILEAQHAYSAANGIDHDNVPALVGLASCALRLGGLGAAHSYLDRAISLDPDSPAVQYTAGRWARARGDLPAAEGAFRAAIYLNPRSADAHANLGAVLLEQHRAPEAVKELREAVSLAPGSAEARNDLGLALVGAGAPALAVNELRTATLLSPGNLDFVFNLGTAQEAAGDLDGAAAAYADVIGRNPKHRAARLNAANLMQRRADLPGAIAAYRSLCADFPDYPSARINLACALRAHREIDEAIRVLEDSSRAFPRDAQVHLLLADIFSKERIDPAREKEHLHAAIPLLDAGSSDRVRAEKRLSELEGE